METLVVAEAGLAERALTDEAVREMFNIIVGQLDETFNGLNPATTEMMSATKGTKLRGGFDSSQCRDV